MYSRKKGENAFGMKPELWYLGRQAYDLKDFINQHPGGKWALMLGRGRDFSGLYHSYHLASLPPESLMAKYRVPEEDLPEEFDPVQKLSFEPNGFYATVKKEVVEHFRKEGKHWKAPWTHVLLYLVHLVLQITTLYLMVARGSIFYAVAHGILRALMVVRSTHSASHFSWSKNPVINRWVYRIGTVMIGLWSPTIWDLQHVVAHHIYTNQWPYDSDSAFPFKSIFPNQRRFWFHRFQHIYMWVVYALTIPLVMLNSIRETIIGHQMLWKVSYQLPGSYAESIGCSVGSVIYLLIPFFFLPFAAALKLVLISAMVSSLFFSLQFVVNHEVDGIVPTKDNTVTPGFLALPPNTVPEHSLDWGRLQMEQSHTFAPHQVLATEIAGGLNTQIEHHLFPGVHYAHYPEIGKIIKRVAARYGIQYFSSPSLLGAITAHFRLLRNPMPTNRPKAPKTAE